MLVVDDILLLPFHGIFGLFREIHKATQAELDAHKSNITAQLSELYMSLETGQITEKEFEAQEQELLDQLD